MKPILGCKTKNNLDLVGSTFTPVEDKFKIGMCGTLIINYHCFVYVIICLQSNLDNLDLDYPDFFLGSHFFMNN